MSHFQYQAVNASGKLDSGVVDAPDRRAALKKLREDGLIAKTLKEANAKDVKRVATAAKSATPTRPSRPGFGGARVKRKHITEFTREIAALLGAGIPVSQALQSLGEEEENPALAEVIQGLGEGLRSGLALSDALAKNPRQFDDLYVSMVKVGEETGALESVMEDLANTMERQDEIRGEMVSAVSYPLFVLGFGVLSVSVLLGFVLPKLFTMLEEMMDTLPLPTLLLINFANFMQNYWYLIALAVVGIAVPVAQYLKKPEGKLAFDRLKLRLPAIGPVVRSAALSRFAQTLGALAKSGVSLLPALKIVEDTIGNRELGRQIASVAEETRGGESLATPLARYQMFPASAIQMIRVGEESGTLDTMLLKIAAIEERHLHAKTKTVISLIAPALILGVGALIGFIVIALLLPIMKMSSSIG